MTRGPGTGIQEMKMKTKVKKLTDRQWSVIEMIHSGLSNKSVQEALRAGGGRGMGNSKISALRRLYIRKPFIAEAAKINGPARFAKAEAKHGNGSPRMASPERFAEAEAAARSSADFMAARISALSAPIPAFTEVLLSIDANTHLPLVNELANIFTVKAVPFSFDGTTLTFTALRNK